jgi:rubrerythrin
LLGAVGDCRSNDGTQKAKNHRKKETHMIKSSPSNAVSRRNVLLFGGATLSGAAVALLAGRPAVAAKHAGGQAAQKDASVINTALALEYEGINAYTLGAQSNLLDKSTLAVAVKFQDDHKAHRDRLLAVLQTLGAAPVKEKSLAEYAEELEVSKLKTQTDVLNFAAVLERGAVNAYLGIIPSFGDHALAKLAGQLASDETVHFAILNNALGRPLPAAFAFGV